MLLRVYTDGGSRGNPGIAGIGVFIINKETNKKYKFYKYIGETTNNQAEYQAAILGLSKALDLGADQVELIADSELLIKQARGEYKVKNIGLKERYHDLKKIEARFDKGVKYKHVKRALNKDADYLANLAMDTKSEKL